MFKTLGRVIQQNKLDRLENNSFEKAAVPNMTAYFVLWFIQN